MRLYIYILVILFSSLGVANGQTAVGTWTLLGPNDQPLRTSPANGNGVGHVARIKFHPTDSQTIYSILLEGGIAISKDRGRHWSITPGTDAMPATQCASVCIDYTNDNILYLGTGNADSYGGGLGVWKSTDGGTTFTQSSTGIGNKMVSEIIMSPTDHNTLLATVCNGGSSTGNIVYKSTDGGATWNQTLSGTVRFDDMRMKPGSKTTVYVVNGITFNKSTDFGSTWTTSALPVVPSTNYSARLAVTPADTNVIYIGASAGNAYILKSTDGGASFTSQYTGSSGCLICYDTTSGSGNQGDYNFTIGLSPVNPNEILLGSQNIWRSLDGGVTWTEVQYCGYAENLMWDMHFLTFDPYYPNEVFLACDGGVWSTVDSLKTLWRARNTGICAMQSYHAAQHPLHRDVLTTADQDVGEQLYTGMWNYIGGGDMDGPHYFDYRPGYNIWSTYVNQCWTASDTADIISKDMNIPFVNDYSANISMGFYPGLPNTAVLGRDTVYICNNISAPTVSWTRIFNNSHQIGGLGFCAADSNILYVLTRDTLYRSDNALAATPTFTKLHTPYGAFASQKLTTTKANSNLVYMTADYKVFVSHDKGATWTNISYNLPASNNITGIIHDDFSPTDRLFVSNGTGVYYKDSTTTVWTLTPGLTTIPGLRELMLYNDGTSASILRVATFGRGIWECPINNDKKPLIAKLIADKQSICPGDTVHYSLNYYGQPTTISWSFPGGSPSSSTSPNPVIVYSTAGSYNVQVVVSNAAGADTLLKTSFINVVNSGAATLSENFEKNIFPPANWLLPVPINIYGWHITDKVGKSSTHSLVFDNYDYDANGAHNRFITAPMDLTGKTKANVTFDIAYQYTYGYSDSLLIATSTDCGDSWTTLYTNGGLSMATATQAPVLLSGAPVFIPSAAQWRTDTISLNTFLGQTVLLAFENIGHGGSTLYLDNINLGTKGVEVTKVTSQSPNIVIYPNPTTGIIHINATEIHGDKITINCYNVLGSIVAQQLMPVLNGSLSTDINLSSLPPGIYQLKLQANDGFSYSNKIVLQ